MSPLFKSASIVARVSLLTCTLFLGNTRADEPPASPPPRLVVGQCEGFKVNGLLVPNLEGRFLGWRPWDYEGGRKIQKAVSATGGTNSAMSSVTNWRAEVFIPYELLKPLQNVPPKSGTEWRANFYRVDYDDKQVTGWDWARVGSSFHDFSNFGTLVFK